MRVSVITATYNRPNLLGRALHSISTQTFKDFEVIVVNDGGCSVEDIISQSKIKDKIRYYTYPTNGACHMHSILVLTMHPAS